MGAVAEMSRAGRKRQDGDRTATGRLSRAAARSMERHVERSAEGLSPAALRRFVETQSASVGGLAYGTPIGRMMLEGRIRAHHFAAAQKWDGVATLYREAILAPSPDPRAMNIGSGGGASPDFDSEKGRREAGRHKAAVAVFERAHAVVTQSGLLAERALRECCEGQGRYPIGHEELLRLCAVLDALWKHWALTGSAR